MPARTATDLASQISTLLADNSSGAISAADVRSVFSDIVDSVATWAFRLGATGTVPDGRIPAGIARDSEIVSIDDVLTQIVAGSNITIDRGTPGRITIAGQAGGTGVSVADVLGVVLAGAGLDVDRSIDGQITLFVEDNGITPPKLQATNTPTAGDVYAYVTAMQGEWTDPGITRSTYESLDDARTEDFALTGNPATIQLSKIPPEIARDSELPTLSSLGGTTLDAALQAVMGGTNVTIDRGTDGQITLNVATPTTGERFHFGAGAPADSLGSDGDTYLNTTSGTFSEKVTGSWVARYTDQTAQAGMADGVVNAITLTAAGLLTLGRSVGGNLSQDISTALASFVNGQRGNRLLIADPSVYDEANDRITGTVSHATVLGDHISFIVPANLGTAAGNLRFRTLVGTTQDVTYPLLDVHGNNLTASDLRASDLHVLFRSGDGFRLIEPLEPVQGPQLYAIADGDVGGTANAITVQTVAAGQPGRLSTIQHGLRIFFKPTAANTGAVTLAVDDVSARPVGISNGVGSQQLQAGDLHPSVPVVMIWDGISNTWKVSAGGLVGNAAFRQVGTGNTNLVALGTGGTFPESVMPMEIARRTALNAYALLAGATFTGRAQGLTRPENDNSHDFATTAYVDRAVSGTTPPAASLIYAGVSADTTFVEAEFTESSSTATISLPAFTANSYAAFAIPESDPDLTHIEQEGSGINEIGSWARLTGTDLVPGSADAMTIDIGGSAHKVWAHVDAQNDPEQLFPVLSGQTYVVR